MPKLGQCRGGAGCSAFKGNTTGPLPWVVGEERIILLIAATTNPDVSNELCGMLIDGFDERFDFVTAM